MEIRSDDEKLFSDSDFFQQIELTNFSKAIFLILRYFQKKFEILFTGGR